MKKAIVITILFMAFVVYLTSAAGNVRDPYTGYNYFNHDARAEMYEKALRLMDRGKFDEAQVIVKKLYGDAVMPFSLALQLGKIYIRQGRYHEALKVYERLREQHVVQFNRLRKPAVKNLVYSHYYFNLGMLYKKMKRFGDSVEAFKKVLRSHNYRVPKQSFEGSRLFSQLTPTQFYANVYFQLGATYMELGETDKAQTQVNRLRELDSHKSTELEQLIADKI